jgi:RNA polymerase sigma-70 factor (ECF subfamily)
MDQPSRSDLPLDRSDVELLRRCAAGEPAALDLLFDRYGGAVAQYLYRLLGNREDAEEAVVDVFMRAWRAAGGYLAIDRLRRRPRLPGAVLPFSELDAETVVSMTDEPEAVFFDAYQRERDRQAVRQALTWLAPQDRALLALHYLEGCTYEQICQITGNSLARVRSGLYRARQRLKRHFVNLRDSDEALDPPALAPDEPVWDPGQLPVF